VSDVFTALSRDSRARQVFVLDDQDRLIGAIPERNVDVDLMSLALPQELLPALRQLDTRDVLRVAKGRSATAQDLMTRARSVALQTPLRDAIAMMSRGDETTLPVVDDSGRLLGYLILFEVLADLAKLPS